MTRQKTTIISCETCFRQINITFYGDTLALIADLKTETYLEENGWYSNIDGDYCPECAPAAREKWWKE